MKTKLTGAQTGHSLLKRKAEALTKRFRTITRQIDEVKIIIIFPKQGNKHLLLIASL